jgi:hypothetical protein
MKLLTVLLAACAIGIVVVQARTAPDDGVSTEAKAAFVKKCVRNVTPAACNAPPQARTTR